MNQTIVLILNIASTWYMVGLIWMVQVVHYKLFDRVGREGFAAYEADHGRLITPIVGIPMLIEIVTAVLLTVMPPTGIPRSWMVAGVLMAGVVWLSTALIQVPCHTALSRGFDQTTYDRLVGSNWIRTVFWTARGVLMATVLWRLMDAASNR